MSTEKPVYLPHRTIPRQLQGQVCECLNTEFAKGLFAHLIVPMPLKSSLSGKKSREIHLCVDYRKLNSITFRDAFPLPCIVEAFTSSA